EEAKKFVKLIKPNKFNADYLRFLAMYYIKVGRLELALDNINKAIQLRKHFSDYHWTRSRILWRLQKNEEAILSLGEADRLSPKSQLIVNSIAMMYDKINQPDSCVYYAKKALAIDSTRFRSYRYIIKWYARAGQIEKANRFKSMYTRCTPTDSIQQKNLVLIDSLLANKGR
ncbi:MAG: hypothetical protein GY865_08300, partial [candidate division Zixibacteria bacterium]|nr:hypothetical protein [candidate division Zixibacteria bacterium]